MRKAAPSIKRSITAFQGGETVYEKSVASRVKRFPRWFSRAAASVILDLTLSNDAKVVYATMGLQTKGNTCSVGVRYLGRLLGMSGTTVKRRIDDLVTAKHLERVDPANGSRGVYRFTSPAFLIPGRCVECGGKWKNLRKSGMCWVCEERLQIRESA